MPRASSASTYGRVTSVCQLTKRRKSRQTCLAVTATGADPLRSVTFQPLRVMIQSTIAPTAPGRDLSIAAPDTYLVAYGDGTGRTTTAGWPGKAGRSGASE